MKTPINVARTKQWKLRVTLKGCCIVRARDDEQRSSSPVRYECSEQRAWHAQGCAPKGRVLREWAMGQRASKCSEQGKHAWAAMDAAPQRALPRPAARQGSSQGSDKRSTTCTRAALAGLSSERCPAARQGVGRVGCAQAWLAGPDALVRCAWALRYDQSSDKGFVACWT